MEHRLDLVGDHLADRNAGPVGDDRGDRLLVDMRVDHPLLGHDLAEFADLGAQGVAVGGGRARRCGFGASAGGAGNLRGRRRGGDRRGGRRRRPAWRSSRARPGFPRPARAPSSQSAFDGARGAPARLGDLGLDLGDALLVGCAEVALARERLPSRFRAIGDGDLGVLDGRGLGVLADGDARAGGVEQAHRLVGQLARRNVAVGKIDRRHDRLVGHAHLVVLLHRSDEAAQHHCGGRDIGLADRGSTGSAGSAPDPSRNIAGTRPRWSRRSCAACRARARA